MQKAAIYTALPQLELVGEEVSEIVEKLREKYRIVAKEIERIGAIRRI